MKTIGEQCTKTEKKLGDPTPMPESALLMATAQIMAEGGAKHSPVNCNTPNSKIHPRGRASENTSQLKNDVKFTSIVFLSVDDSFLHRKMH